MTIMEGNFSAQSVTSKGKVYKYDDLRCQMNDIKRNASIQKQTVHYVANYLNGEEFLEHGQSFFVMAADFNSPMAGNVAAFKTETDAKELAEQKGGQPIMLQDAFR
jgi:copper chaperone NosL